MRRTGGTSAVLYRPYAVRLVLRAALAWVAIRATAAGLARMMKESPAPMHPLGSLWVVLAVIAVGEVHARAMREPMFRANAGIEAWSIWAIGGATALLLEVVARSLT